MDIDPQRLPEDPALLRQMVTSLVQEVEARERRLRQLQQLAGTVAAGALWAAARAGERGSVSEIRLLQGLHSDNGCEAHGAH